MVGDVSPQARLKLRRYLPSAGSCWLALRRGGWRVAPGLKASPGATRRCLRLDSGPQLTATGSLCVACSPTRCSISSPISVGPTARRPKTFSPFWTTGSHKQLSERGTPTNRLLSWRTIERDSSYPRPSLNDSRAKVTSKRPSARALSASCIVSQLMHLQPRGASKTPKVSVTRLSAPTTKIFVCMKIPGATSERGEIAKTFASRLRR
jgi:hypothetical protein